jgi:hypothetical protein
MFIVKRLPVLAVAAGLAILAGCGTAPVGQPGAGAGSAPGSSAPGGSASGNTGPGNSVPGSTASPGSGATPSTGPSAGTVTPSARTVTPSASGPAPSAACQEAGIYLTSVKVAQHAGFDRVVFEFSGGLPPYTVTMVTAVYSDPKGDVVPLPGEALLRVVFHGATATCPRPLHRTYAGSATLTPRYPRLLAVSAAGDFERVLSFGIGLAAKSPYHAYTLTSPDRVVLDVGAGG